MYGNNEMVKILWFQSPIGTQKTMYGNNEMVKILWFQSPIGTQKT